MVKIIAIHIVANLQREASVSFTGCPMQLGSALASRCGHSSAQGT
jgi:hypothetical protein